jgi:hypothetical protein
MIKLPTLKDATNRLEDSIITLSGPALAISGIIAGVDLLTGGNMLKQASWLSLTWAITLLLTLDFNVLSLGARAHKVYLSSDKSGGRKATEIVIAFVIAGAISMVSIQMQSIIARTSGSAITIDQAAAQLGINMIWLIWERSALVLVLIFMSGWLREESSDHLDQPMITPTNSTTDEAIKQLAEQVSLLTLSVTQITTTVTEVKTTITAITEGDRGEQQAIAERTEAIIAEPLLFTTIKESDQGEQSANIGERIREVLASNPAVTDRELAAMVGCSSSTANKWRKRIEQAA